MLDRNPAACSQTNRRCEEDWCHKFSAIAFGLQTSQVAVVCQMPVCFIRSPSSHLHI